MTPSDTAIERLAQLEEVSVDICQIDATRVISELISLGKLGERLDWVLLSQLDLGQPDNDGVIPFELITQEGDYDSAERLSSYLDAHHLGFESLNILISENQNALLDSLLLAGANPDAFSSDGKNLLFEAVSTENLEASQILLDHSAKTETLEPEFNPLVLSVLKGFSGLAVELIHRGMNPNIPSGNMTAVDAAELVLDEKVLMAVAAKAPAPTPDRSIATRVSLAELGLISGISEQWSPEVTEALRELQAKVGLPAHGHPSLQSLLALSELLQRPFLQAAATGDVGKVGELLNYFPNLVAREDQDGWDALKYAAYAGHTEVASILIAAGSDANRPDHKGSNSLLISVMPDDVVRTDQESIVAMLLSKGADADLKNDDGTSARKIAAMRGNWLAQVIPVRSTESDISEWEDLLQ